MSQSQNYRRKDLDDSSIYTYSISVSGEFHSDVVGFPFKNDRGHPKNQDVS